mmetsp:Transcript_13275/g.26168  ORF Transcript_13275/g.26168 Transcript_13275/m.26168 type:complete len:149 (-) Transcript_13275:309-755(-)
MRLDGLDGKPSSWAFHRCARRLSPPHLVAWESEVVNRDTLDAYIELQWVERHNVVSGVTDTHEVEFKNSWIPHCDLPIYWVKVMERRRLQAMSDKLSQKIIAASRRLVVFKKDSSKASARARLRRAQLGKEKIAAKIVKISQEINALV